jgi:alanine racemase
MTEGQIEKFLNLLENLSSKGISFSKIHIANSDAINNFPMTYHTPFNYVRTGINIYGSFDNEGQRILNLEPILTLKTKLAAVRTLPAGMTLGYGCTYKLMKDTRVGTIAAGYADGLPLALSNRGYVIINGSLCPVLGRVSMDYTTVSLEDAPDAKIGDEVICLGGEGPRSISVDDWAQIKGTHAYEIICSFGTRVARRYIED